MVLLVVVRIEHPTPIISVNLLLGHKFTTVSRQAEAGRSAWMPVACCRLSLILHSTHHQIQRVQTSKPAAMVTWQPAVILGRGRQSFTRGALEPLQLGCLGCQKQPSCSILFNIKVLQHCYQPSFVHRLRV